MKFIISLFLCLLHTLVFCQDQPEESKVRESYRFEFSPPPYEVKCFEHFTAVSDGVNNVNAFLLAKMTEMMYSERLDYQIRYLQNGCSVVDTIPSSEWIKKHSKVTEASFQTAFAERFQHYFPSNVEPIKTPEGEEFKANGKYHTGFKYIKKTHTTEASFLGYKYQQGLDPELMVVSTPTVILILFRGTDDVKKSEWAEWTGTNLRINQMNAGGALVGTRIHTGFWLSFDLIRDELISTLAKFDAPNKKIWIAGHSLGAALSVITGVYLKSSGLDVQNVYAYACPRTIGNKKFVAKANTLLPNRIQRFEYSQDPITLLWAPGFKYHYVGQRNWYDEAEKGQYRCYKKTQERVLISAPVKKYPFITEADKKEAKRIKQDQINAVILWGTKQMHYHNPQWYVKATYQQLTEEEKKRLPLVDDSYPYLYYMKKDSR